MLLGTEVSARGTELTLSTSQVLSASAVVQSIVLDLAAQAGLCVPLRFAAAFARKGESLNSAETEPAMPACASV